MYIEIRVQWTINFGSSHMRVHACDTEACDMCYVFNVNLTSDSCGCIICIYLFWTLSNRKTKSLY